MAWGGLQVLNTMDANVGPAIMVVGFSGIGISLAGTGAGYIHEVRPITRVHARFCIVCPCSRVRGESEFA